MKSKPLLFLDTNIFIYFFQDHPDFGQTARDIFARLTTTQVTAVTSTLTVTELLSIKMTEEEVDTLYRRLLETPNLKIIGMDMAIAVTAARLRRRYGFRVPDSLQLASALEVKADQFVTGDRRLRQCRELEVRSVE